jgi:hypothetical protein
MSLFVTVYSLTRQQRGAVHILNHSIPLQPSWCAHPCSCNCVSVSGIWSVIFHVLDYGGSYRHNNSPTAEPVLTISMSRLIACFLELTKILVLSVLTRFKFDTDSYRYFMLSRLSFIIKCLLRCVINIHWQLLLILVIIKITFI